MAILQRVICLVDGVDFGVFDTEIVAMFFITRIYSVDIQQHYLPNS